MMAKDNDKKDEEESSGATGYIVVFLVGLVGGAFGLRAIENGIAERQRRYPGRMLREEEEEWE